MSRSSKTKVAIVISGVWPDKKNGYGLAVASALNLYAGFFDRTYYFGPSKDSFHASVANARSSIKYVPVGFGKESRLLRFFKSLFGATPAITAMYRTGKSDVVKELEEILRDEGQDALYCVIFEDTPSAVLLDCIRSICPGARFILRSHNVLVNGFAGMTTTGSFLSRLAWRLEMSKIRRFERVVLKDLDTLWAISEFDADEYERIFDKKTDGVLGIAFDGSANTTLFEGNSKTVIFLGSADLRKGMGLLKFVRDCWPHIKVRVDSAQLVLGGKGTEKFDDPVKGISGLGFVVDEGAFLASGRIFINPQLVGSGVKLKSIVAMLAGRALVSTPNGIEGVAGYHGVHFYRETDWNAMATRIVELLENPDVSRKIGEAARDLAGRTYAVEPYERAGLNLLNRAVE